MVADAWISDGARTLRRLDPRGPAYGPPGSGGGVEYAAPNGDHLTWHTFTETELPAGKISSLSSSTTRDCAIVTMDSGASVEVSIDGGVSTASPLQPVATGARWEAAGGRLPCGNHDICNPTKSFLKPPPRQHSRDI